jgi:hypothetical protein
MPYELFGKKLEDFSYCALAGLFEIFGERAASPAHSELQEALRLYQDYQNVRTLLQEQRTRPGNA